MLKSWFAAFSNQNCTSSHGQRECGFLDEFSEFILIMGDFNIHINFRSEPLTVGFQTTTDTSGFTQINKGTQKWYYWYFTFGTNLSVSNLKCNGINVYNSYL